MVHDIHSCMVALKLDLLPLYILYSAVSSTGFSKDCVCADNVASDLIMPQSDYRFPIGFGTEVQPCGYPLLNGHIN